ncbi:hypothetical protein P9112_010065 [Eukaryota sp. TZLM1-RC]
MGGCNTCDNFRDLTACDFCDIVLCPLHVTSIAHGSFCICCYNKHILSIRVSDMSPLFHRFRNTSNTDSLSSRISQNTVNFDNSTAQLLRGERKKVDSNTCSGCSKSLSRFAFLQRLTPCFTCDAVVCDNCRHPVLLSQFSKLKLPQSVPDVQYVCQLCHYLFSIRLSLARYSHFVDLHQSLLDAYADSLDSIENLNTFKNKVVHFLRQRFHGFSKEMVVIGRNVKQFWIEKVRQFDS